MLATTYLNIRIRDVLSFFAPFINIRTIMHIAKSD